MSSELNGASQKPECNSESVSQVKINGSLGEERKLTCTNVMGLGDDTNIKS